MTAATQSMTFSQIDGPAAHEPSSHTARGRYTRQKAHASISAATATMYGRKGAQRAIVTAPDTPKRTTAHGPMQHNPMNDATALMPMAPPVVVAIFLFSPIAASPAELNGWTLHRAVRTVNTAVTRLRAQHFAAALAVVKELAGICGHAFLLLVPALRAGNH